MYYEIKYIWIFTDNARAVFLKVGVALNFDKFLIKYVKIYPSLYFFYVKSNGFKASLTIQLAMAVILIL